MKRTALLAVCLGGWLTTQAQANLLDDPGFELATGGGQVSNSNWSLAVNFPDGVEDSAQFQDAPWASNPLGVEGVGVWFKAFEGNQAAGDALAEATLSQTVAAGPGMYDLSFYVRHEENFTAGAMTVALSSDQGDLATFDLLATPNDGEYNQFSIDGFVAGAGTTNLTIEVIMEEGTDAMVNPQSLMVDDFDLSVVPEPSTGRAGRGGAAGSLRDSSQPQPNLRLGLWQRREFGDGGDRMARSVGKQFVGARPTRDQLALLPYAVR